MAQRFALSTSFSDVSRQLDRLAERDLGVEITLYDTEWLLNLGKTTGVRKLGDELAQRGVEVSVHAPIFDLNPGSLDPVVRKHTRLCWERTISVAGALGARHANFHTGYLPLLPESTLPGWMALSLEVWERLVGLAADASINVHIFGTASLDTWWQELGTGIREVHLHDTDTFSDDHLLLGDGAIDWRTVFENLFRYAPDAMKVIEMPVEAGLQSLARIRAGGYSDIQLELL
jgi:sugar phosphate isomerase/epimerase